MKTKDEIHPELKQFFEKAKKKGWKKGQHLFNFLDETDMMRYDNIKEKLVRDKWKDAYEGERFAREECEKEIKQLKEKESKLVELVRNLECEITSYEVETNRNHSEIKRLQNKLGNARLQTINRIRKEIEKFENPYPKDIFRWNNKEKMEITRGRFNQFAYETVENVREKVLKILEGRNE